MKNEIAFPQSTLKFLAALSKNNSKVWFEKNRIRFDFELLQPAVQFVIDLGEELTKLSPNIVAIPKIDKSIFRLHRDVRFSKDKSPYKTNLGYISGKARERKWNVRDFIFISNQNYFFLVQECINSQKIN